MNAVVRQFVIITCIVTHLMAKWQLISIDIL